MPKTYTIKQVKSIINDIFESYDITTDKGFCLGFEKFLNEKGLNSNNGDNTDNQTLTEEYLNECIESFII